MKGMFSAWLGNGTQICVCDVRITKDADTYIYHPLRGNACHCAVEDIHGNYIGYMCVEDLPGGPYKDVKEWMEKVQWCGKERR